jgi:hypothetical protein
MSTAETSLAVNLVMYLHEKMASLSECGLVFPKLVSADDIRLLGM